MLHTKSIHQHPGMGAISACRSTSACKFVASVRDSVFADGSRNITFNNGAWDIAFNNGTWDRAGYWEQQDTAHLLCVLLLCVLIISISAYISACMSVYVLKGTYTWCSGLRRSSAGEGALGPDTVAAPAVREDLCAQDLHAVSSRCVGTRASGLANEGHRGQESQIGWSISACEKGQEWPDVDRGMSKGPPET